jgi:hypothetical protein
MKKKLIFTEEMVKTIWTKTMLTTLLFFIPVGQFYAALIAFPLFLIPSIGQESEFMGYTFAYFYPKNILIIPIFVIYYLLVFYIYEYIKVKIKIKNHDKASTKKKDTKNNFINTTQIIP